MKNTILSRLPKKSELIVYSLAIIAVLIGFCAVAIGHYTGRIDLMVIVFYISVMIFSSSIKLASYYKMF